MFTNYTILDLLKDLVAIYSIGVLLHWYAFSIAWGWRRGCAKVGEQKTQNITIGKDLVETLLVIMGKK